MSQGVRYMLLASFTFSLMMVCVKLVPHIPAIEIILFRSVISGGISWYLLKKQRVSVWGNNKLLLLGRGASGAIALVIIFALLQQIPLATSSALSYLAPIFTTIIGIFFVRERVRPVQWLFFAISFSGILVIQGFDARISFTHLTMGVVSTLFMGLAYNIIRKLKTSEHPLVVIFYFPLVMLPISAVWSANVWVMPYRLDWLILVAIGILTQIAQFFMTKSYQQEALNKVSIVGYVGIIYSLFFGYFIFDESFNMLTYAGMALVLLGVILNITSKKAGA